MSTPQPNEPSVKPGDPAGKTDVEPSFDEQLHALWEKKENRTTVFVGCAIVALAIIGWYGYKAFEAQREGEIEASYSAAVTPARLRTFAKENQGHPLAGVAFLRMADDEYTAGGYAAAIDDYDRAAATLAGTPFASRAILGRAMCQIRSDKTADGTAALRKLAGDASQQKAVRCEAAYHLASLAFDAGNNDDVSKLADLIMQVDAGGVWAQRANQLRTRIPAAAAVPGAAQAQAGGRQ